MKKTGIFGGSFNPVHTAHLILAELAGETAGLDEVIFVPAGMPPHKQHEPLAAPHHRLAMLRLATEDNPRFAISDLELKRKGPSYTLTTVNELLKSIGGNSQLTLLLGADSVRDLHSWYRAKELLETVHITGLHRPGVDESELDEHIEAFGHREAEKLKHCFITVPRIDISASDVRKRVNDGRSIRYIVPEKVRKYITENGLYK